MFSDERIYLTRDGRPVREGDPEAATLLVGRGCYLADTEARRLGLPLPPPQSQAPQTQSPTGARPRSHDRHRARTRGEG